MKSVRSLLLKSQLWPSLGAAAAYGPETASEIGIGRILDPDPGRGRVRSQQNNENMLASATLSQPLAHSCSLALTTPV